LTIAVYAGTFDPLTNGHLDVTRRAAPLFDQLVVAIYDQSPKNLLFDTQQRLEMFRASVTDLKNVRVEPYSGLTVDYAKRIGAHVIIRGLRSIADFEREFQMALMNKKLEPEIEVVCLMTGTRYEFISSSLIKEVAMLGGDITDIVPPAVAEALSRKFGGKR
jgi:pantetheine-phosphate adenylyltransferase